MFKFSMQAFTPEKLSDAANQGLMYYFADGLDRFNKETEKMLKMQI